MYILKKQARSHNHKNVNALDLNKRNRKNRYPVPRFLRKGLIYRFRSMKTVLTRLLLFYETQFLTIQFFSRPCVGYSYGVYLMKQLQDIVYHSNKKLYTCYVDLPAAYNHISIDFHFLSIRNPIPSSKSP